MLSDPQQCSMTRTKSGNRFINILEVVAKRGRYAHGKQWNTEGNVDRDKKGGFRKLIVLIDAVDTIVWCSTFKTWNSWNYINRSDFSFLDWITSKLLMIRDLHPT